MMNDHYDVLVIGGGPGGTPAAMQLASRGKKVLLAERSGKLGGACLFAGCIPSKIIKHAADEHAAAGRNTPAAPEGRSGAWRNIRATMGKILSGRSEAALQRVTRLPALTFVAGTARFVAKDRVEIEDNGGAKSTCTFGQAIIATGSAPTVPPFRGSGAKHVLTTEMLFVQEALPESLVIIGGGPIGIEMAQMLTKLNVACTVIEMQDAILKGLVEPEFADRLAHKLRESNIAVHTAATVQEISRSGDEFSTTFLDAAGGLKTLRSRQVLVAAGRRPNVEGLDLEAAGIECTKSGIAVNEYLETNVKGIYAAGDVTAGPKFAHTATYEAHIAAANILQGNVRKTDLAKNSWVLFSDPEIASAGYTEAEAARHGYEVETGTYDYRIDAAAQVSGNPEGLLKFVVDRRTLQIVGVHLCVNGAASAIGEGALIVSKQLTLMDVAQAIHPHPTLTEAFGALAMTMLAETQVSAAGPSERSAA